MAASTSSSPPEANSLQRQGMQRWEVAIPEIQKEDRINNCLPIELLLLIFCNLSEDSLHKVSRVCRLWKKLASDPSLMPMEVYLRVIHPELKIRYIGESFWKKYEPYFHLIAKDPPFSDREIIVEKAKKMLEEVSVEDDAGITLLLEPEGFSFRLLRKGCKTLNDGGKDLFRYVSRDVVNLVGNDPEKETQLLGLTTGIVKNTRYKTVDQQKEDFQKIGCELANAKTLSLLAIATFLQSREEGRPIRLLPRPLTLSRCIESKQEKWGVWNACVGGFCPDGLCVNKTDYDSRNLNQFSYMGAVGLRKF